jgi:hypothetical protein
MSQDWRENWTEFGRKFNLPLPALDWLASQADVPVDLIFLPLDEVVDCVVKFGGKRATALRVIKAFDEWDAITRVIHMTGDSKAALSDAFDAPSDLIFTNFEDNEMPNVKRSTFEKVKLFARQQFTDVATRHEVPFDIGPVSAAGFDLGHVVGHGGVVAGGMHVMDEALARVGGGMTIKDILLAQQANPERIVGLRLALGYICDVNPLVESIDSFQRCAWIDLHVNRIDASQFQNVKTLAATLAERNGVLVVYGNPVVSSDTRELMSQWATAAESNAQERKALLHMIWLPSTVAGHTGNWSHMLGRPDEHEQLVEDVVAAHKAFFSWARHFDFDA